MNQVSVHIDAVKENRMISVQEGDVRKKVGAFLLASTIASWFLLPMCRTYYGFMSVAFASSVGIYRTGYQSL